MNVFMTEMPAFIKKEMEQLQKMIAPLDEKGIQVCIMVLAADRGLAC
ncbi:DUF5392 family protein [Virgibacillus halophilus]|uniref:DUF5392 family protein n=1 Tax=Tigheibacillus halophilus TaxID=361280 RepID=A0ABU5C530_9BACI|nr:DUF5392 family protein [Virgibacillus halophilus]